MMNTSSSSVNDLAILDMAALDTLATLFGDEGPSALVGLIDEYLSEIDHALPQMDNAIDEQNSNGLYVLAHTLKSSSANMGAITVAEIAKQIEAAARIANWNDASEHLETLKKELPRAQDAMNQYRATLDA